MPELRKIAITMGEPGGIGPECVMRSLNEARALCHPMLVGDPEVFAEAAELTGVSLKDILIIPGASAKGYRKGRPTPEGGRASAEAIRKAVELAVTGTTDAIVTAPISKEALKMAGIVWPGHTEMLAELTGTEDFAMMLTGGPLRVMLVTIHEPISRVPSLITRARVLRTLRLARIATRMLKIQNARIAVAGLNPHAGEAGIFGTEEADAIAPAIEEARREGIDAVGPLPGDTVFYQASRGAYDLVVAMYHDQGLAPLKLVGFDSGVNTTIGLPIIRTSPDHGTAYDIAWRGKASAESTLAAIKLALALVRD